MAFAAMTKLPKGFPRYKDKEASKFFRENELFPTPKALLQNCDGDEAQPRMTGCDRGIDHDSRPFTTEPVTVLSDRRRWLSSAVPLDRLAPSPLLPGPIPVNRGFHGGA